jgi:putative ABC transport system substrate-binding protein
MTTQQILEGYAEARTGRGAVVNLAMTLAAVTLLLPIPLATAAAQSLDKTPRIGILSSGARSSPGFVDGFLQGLSERGWVEGKNIAIEYRWADGRSERLPDLVAQLISLKVDVIFAITTAGAVAAKHATGTIPIVMATGSDVERLGLVASLTRPGGNVTGLSFDVDQQTISKGLELLKDTIPKIRRVAVLSNPANPSHVRPISDLKLAARALGLQLRLLEARGADEFDSVFAEMVQERAGALLVLGACNGDGRSC